MRLVWRIYLLGVLLAVMVIGSFFFVARAVGPSRNPLTPQLVTEIVANADSPEELVSTVEHLRVTYELAIVVRDARGVVLAGGPDNPHAGRVSTHAIKGGPAAGGTAVIGAPTPPLISRRFGFAVALILVLLGVGTAWVARWLGRPLARVTAAAQAFGSGDLSARVGLARRDELGQVAAAFDEMADRVERLLRTERELLANVSHELRTPLARIRTALDIATEGDPDTAQEMLGEIGQDLGELSRLVDDVLTTTRLELDSRRSSVSKLPVRREPIVVHELVEQSVSRFRTTHPETTLEVQLDADLPGLVGDPMLLRRVLDNLLENAWRYGPKEGPIEVGASCEAEHLVLAVIDRGMGMSKEELEQAFRPFFRAETSRTRATGGLGLGLTLAQRIVEAHGGTIRLSSKVGAGTTVHVELPTPSRTDGDPA